jgi:leucyl-tRNA synthetase
MIQGRSARILRLNLVPVAGSKSGKPFDFFSYTKDAAQLRLERGAGLAIEYALNPGPQIFISADVLAKLTAEGDDLRKPTSQAVHRSIVEHARRLNDLNENVEVSLHLLDEPKTWSSDVLVSIDCLAGDDDLNVEAVRNWREDFKYATFISGENGFKVIRDTDKMSKSKYNVVNPDDIISKYGADTLRLYEMFLGPLEQSKPWDTNGIEGTFRFLKKFWGLYHDKQDRFGVSDDSPEKEELKVLHATLSPATNCMNSNAVSALFWSRW